MLQERAGGKIGPTSPKQTLGGKSTETAPEMAVLPVIRRLLRRATT